MTFLEFEIFRYFDAEFIYNQTRQIRTPECGLLGDGVRIFLIEVVRETQAEARSFLDALFYSDSVSAIGHRAEGKKTRAVAVNWDADEETELDERVSQLVSDALDSGKDEDVYEIAAYCRIFPETVLYQPELASIE